MNFDKDGVLKDSHSVVLDSMVPGRCADPIPPSRGSRIDFNDRCPWWQ